MLWKTDLLINNEECDSFTILKSHFRSQSGNLSLGTCDKCDIKGVMCSHLDALILHFEKYFEDMEKHNWIRNPFVSNANLPQGSTSLEAEQFVDLTSNLTLKSLYNPNSLISFWVQRATSSLLTLNIFCTLFFIFYKKRDLNTTV